jgi:trehalose/maltose hydrolase-like predicted phosphorylase
VVEADAKRHIRHVIGPDEYHADVDDNAFINVMARRNIARALKAVDCWVSGGRTAPPRFGRSWHLATTSLRTGATRSRITGLDPATGACEQFAGFHALEPLDLAADADRTAPIDVVIGRERTQRSQVFKY